MADQPSQLNQYLDLLFTYGPVWAYVILFAACFIENIFPPFPGDSFIVAAGGLVALDRLSLITSMLVIIAGGMTSVMVLYFVGKNYGRDFFLRKNYKYFSVDDIGKMEAKLGKWGALILICSRFVVGVRAALALAAGVGRYPTVGMVIYSTISYLIFTSLLMYASINLVEHIETIEYYFTTYDRIVYPILIVLVILWLVRKYWAIKKKV
ncbi:MAG TPA: DedA family protein [Candidatus Acidoferrum sp.]|nr:DedA family protein [Candidatus Acidoferrum sp.]